MEVQSFIRRFVPSLSALIVFEAAAPHVNFTEAAEDLGLTQSGISHQIANLETLLGVTFFERIGSRLVLTDVAKKAYRAEIAEALDRIEQASVTCVRGQSLERRLLIVIARHMSASASVTGASVSMSLGTLCSSRRGCRSPPNAIAGAHRLRHMRLGKPPPL